MSKFYSIVSNENFFKKASQLVLDFAYDKSKPESLAQAQIWVPSSRIAQSLQDELTKQLGNFAILPDIKTISFDESDIQSLQFYNSSEDFFDQEFLSPASKMLYFAKALSFAMPDWTFQQCFAESTSLIKLHQDLQSYDISLEQLAEAVPFELASHWEKNLHIVKAVFAFYDQFLEENNKQDKYTFQNKLIELFVQQYDKSYQGQVFAVGFNDTTSLGKKILHKIANLENGKFIFPYINLENLEYEELEASHVQYTIHKLAKELNINPQNITMVGEESSNVKFLNKMFLPFDRTNEWFETQSTESKLENVTLVNAQDLLEEAKSIALIMRESLTHEDKTCALISPNRVLAQNVIQELKKWNIDVNDSAGVALTNTVKGQLALDILNMLIEDFAVETVIPVVTSDALSHDFDFNFLQARRDFIEIGLTGSNVDSSLKALSKKIKQELPWQNHKAKDEQVASAVNILKLLEDISTDVDLAAELTLRQWSLNHLDLILKLVKDEFLFDGDEGKALVEVFAELKQAENTTKINLKTYVQTFKLLLDQTMVRQTTNLHPRLFVWGSPEARLQSIDRIVIADFNDATWPGKLKSSLWLNPSIRKQLNMPDISVSAGLNANDLYNQLLAKEVFITRSKKDDNGETVPSRFLIRLENALVKQIFDSYKTKGQYYLDLLAEIEKQKVANYLLDEKYDSAIELQSIKDFPTYISASSVKDLANCPYKFYLSKIAKVKEVEDISEVGANLWGTTVHLMLEGFFAGIPMFNIEKLTLPLNKDKKDDYIERCNRIIDRVLKQVDSSIIDLSWRHKLEVIAEEFVELSLQDLTQVAYTERELKANGFRAILDRADIQIGEDSRYYNIIDYKTGKPPSRNDIVRFKDPQLLVESYILENNNQNVGELTYWHVKGYGAKPIEIFNVAEPSSRSKEKITFEELKQEGFEKLVELRNTFKSDKVKYHPYSHGTTKAKQSVCKYCPYSGICRKFSL
jgi:ATP-dependent helicase/nuclease subunit B